MGGKQGVSVALVLMSGALWGTTGLLQALTPAGTPPLTVGSVRVVVAGVIMLIYCLFKRGPGFLKKTRPVPLVTATAGMMGYQFAFFSALRLTGVSVGTMIAIGAIPMFAGFLGATLEGQPLTRRWWVSTAVAVTGCVLLSLGGQRGDITIQWGGVALAFLAALSSAFLGIGLKRQSDSVGPLEATTVTLVGSALVGLVVLFLWDSSWIFTPKGALIAAALGVGTMALPFTTFSYGLRNLRMGDAYTLALVEPLTACVLSAVFLGERLAPASMAGALLIILGILLLSVSRESS